MENSIKTYEDFCNENLTNEEINIKKALAGAALGAGLAFGSPAKSQTVTPTPTTQTQQVSSEKIKWGSTIEDVKARFANQETDGHYLNAQRTAYELIVPNYKFLTHDCKAIFKFSNGGLNNISYEYEYSKLKFIDIKSTLTDKYGAPFTVSNKSGQSYRWSKSNANVSLTKDENTISVSIENAVPVEQSTEQSTSTTQAKTIKSETAHMTDSEKFDVLRNELMQMKNDQTEVKLNLYKCHQEFKVGVGMAGAGLGLGILAYAQVQSDPRMGDVAKPIAIIGSILSLAGSIVMIDSHKFIGRASLTGIKVDFGGTPSHKKIEPGDYFLYMGPGAK